MKIIHSYWTKPYLSKENDNIGGWSSNLFHYMSCALSCLLAKKFYDIELVTDNKGVELFIDKIQLPYSSVKVVLNDLDEYDTELWALGKIYTYSIQEEPFLHIDNDLFIWDRFKTKILNANLVGQHLEIGYKHNELFFDDILTNLSYIPDVILQRNIIDRGVIEINAGVLGGKNMFFFKEYTKEAFCFVERNLNQISKLKHKGMFNTIFEQYLFYCMARELNETVEFLINDDVDDRFLGLADFWSVPYDLKYIHTVGFYKKFYMIGEQISQRLWFEYPEYYERIVQLYKKGLI